MREMARAGAAMLEHAQVGARGLRQVRRRAHGDLPGDAPLNAFVNLVHVQVAEDQQDFGSVLRIRRRRNAMSIGADCGPSSTMKRTSP
jgi:hypothetical protein